MNGYYPAGVTDADFDIEYVECPVCGEECFSDECENCGADVPSPDEMREDAEYAAADRAYDLAREDRR